MSYNLRFSKSTLYIFQTEIILFMHHECVFDDDNKVEPKLHLTFMSNNIHGTESWIIDRFTKRLLWNIVWSRPVSMEEYNAESMLENKFCSNVALSLSSGPPLIYKAKYKGLISQNLYPAITFDWSVLRT